MARMTEEEFNKEQADLLGGIPPELHSALQHFAWDKGHSAGYEEVVGVLTL